eukprot:PhF_6_TR485/c0_g1_i3/m.234
MPTNMRYFHVYKGEFYILFTSVFITMCHEYVLRHYFAKTTFSRMGPFHRLFACILIANIGMLLSNKNIIDETVEIIITAGVGFLPLTFIQLYRKRFFGFLYLAAIWASTVYKYIAIDRHPHVEGVGMIKKIERLTPVSFFLPCLHPGLAKYCKGVTAPLWSVVALMFVFEVELVYRVLMEGFIGDVGLRRQASLATETLAVFVVLGAAWDNL